MSRRRKRAITGGETHRDRTPLRILHCPAMVGGNPQGLARAERELGLESHAVSLVKTWPWYETVEALVESGAGIARIELARWKLLRRAFRDYDVIHFNAGKSIMPMRVWKHPEMPRRRSLLNTIARRLYNLYAGLLELRDVRWLKRAGKGIAVTFQGSDARQGDFCRDRFEVNAARGEGAALFPPGEDLIKRCRIRKFAENADCIYALNPDLLHVLPDGAKFLPYSHIDMREWTPVRGPADANEPRLVVHAPSRQGIKGTRFIRDAVERLQTEGFPLEFVLAEELPHVQVMDLFARADLIIDQLLIGWYGAVAVEGMALGKPVICYIREGDLHFIPSQMREQLPIINANPETVYDVLRQWILAPQEELIRRGEQGRAYVEAWHDPLKAAEQLKLDYEAMTREP